MKEWEWQLLEDRTPVDFIEIRGVQFRRGDSIKLRPQAGGDILDIALAGKTAVIESIEQDYEGKLHLGVVLDDDPGRDIGLMRQPGHRFFFSSEEIEPLGTNESDTSRSVRKLLIAGIGNIFLGDDGFGSEVIRRLTPHTFPAGVRAADFGIRGLDLAYALMEGYETTILIDACPAAGAPGTVFVLEPDLAEFDHVPAQGFIEPHAMNPMNVLRMASSMGAKLHRILLVGCVPETLGPEEGHMGLSQTVAAAVDEASRVVTSLVTRVLAGEWPASK